MVFDIVAIAGVVVAGWIGSIEYRLRTANLKLGKIPDRDEVTKTVELKHELMFSMITSIRNDLDRIVSLLDKMYLKDR